MYKKGKHSHIQLAWIITGHSHLTYVCHSGILDENLPEWSIRGYSTKIYPIRSYGATRRKSTRVVDSGLLDENPHDKVMRGYSTKIHPNSKFGATRRKSTRAGTFEATHRKSTRIAIRGYSLKIHPNCLPYFIRSNDSNNSTIEHWLLT